MKFTGLPGKGEGYFLQAVRFFGNNTGERTLSRDEFVFCSKALPVCHKADGLRRRDPQFKDRAGRQEFSPGTIGLEARIVEFSQRIAALVFVGNGRSALSGTDILVNVNGSVFTHNQRLSYKYNNFKAMHQYIKADSLEVMD